MRFFLAFLVMLSVSACASDTPVDRNVEMIAWLSDNAILLDTNPVAINNIPVSADEGTHSYRFELPSKQPSDPPQTGNIYFVNIGAFNPKLADYWSERLDKIDSAYVEVEDRYETYDHKKAGSGYAVITALDLPCEGDTTCQGIGTLSLVTPYGARLSGDSQTPMLVFDAASLIEMRALMEKYGISGPDICGFDPYIEPVPRHISAACIGRMRLVMSRENQYVAETMAPNSVEALKEYVTYVVETGEFSEKAPDDPDRPPNTRLKINGNVAFPFAAEERE